MFAGEFPGFEPYPSPMPDLDCADCHGEAPELMRPDADGCEMCHDEDYREIFDDWRSTTQEYLDELRALLAGPEGAAATPEARARAQRALDLAAGDGSLGVHNPFLVESMIQEGIDALQE